jgi:hypothetical protein
MVYATASVQSSSQLRGSLVAALLTEKKTVKLLRFVRSGGRRLLESS